MQPNSEPQRLKPESFWLFPARLEVVPFPCEIVARLEVMQAAVFLDGQFVGRAAEFGGSAKSLIEPALSD